MSRVMLLLCIFLILIFLGCLLPVFWPFEVVYALAAGWLFFLARTVTTMEIDWGSTATAVVTLIALMVGLHWFFSWALDQGSPAQQSVGQRRWRFAWTASVVGLIVLAFVAGIAAVGLTHQSTWLATSPEPFIQGGIREAAARTASSSNLRQIGTAAHMVHDNQKQLPSGATFDKHGRALHGWQTALLPYLEETALYQQINLQLPWNDAANAPLFHKEIAVYQYNFTAQRQDAASFAVSHFASNVRLVGGGPAMKLGDITDGSSSTILFGEAAGNYRPWGHPANWRDPALGINTTLDGFGNPKRAGALFVMADASVHFISQDVSPNVLKALSTPRGGERIDLKDFDAD